MNLFYNLPSELQNYIYEFEGGYNKKIYLNIIDQIRIFNMQYFRIFKRISFRLSFSLWYFKYKKT